MRHPTALGMALLLSTTPALADDRPWKGSAELGFVATSGNTQTQTLNVRAAAEYATDGWVHSAAFEALNNNDGTRTTAERYLLRGKSTRSLSETDYVFGGIQYEDDRFSGYDYQLTGNLGYGRRLVDRDELKVNAEIGPGARRLRLNEGDTSDEITLHLGGDLAWKVSESATLTEVLTMDTGSDAAITRSVTALQTRVIGSLALKASLTIKHTSDVPAGTRKTDTETALTLVYNF